MIANVKIEEGEVYIRWKAISPILEKFEPSIPEAQWFKEFIMFEGKEEVE